jgi:dihydropteroate synthase
MATTLKDRYGRGPLLMGIVNVTPDSFSDGGRFLPVEAAARQARRLAAAGASFVDVGGESTRPGAEPASEDEELARVVPVLERLTGLPAAISIDTAKPAVAARALELGATLVNDVTAMAADGMVELVAERGADVCLMHMQGTPRTMQDEPRYGDVVAEVSQWLAARVDAAVAGGVARGRICVDSGIGFGKTPAHNLALIRGTGAIERACGVPVVVGASRKGFLGAILGDPSADRTVATVTAGLAAVDAGAWMLRVHDVEPHRHALAVRAAFAEVVPA